jgi:polyhydroxyalkanoate synthesis regulator phasin
MSETPKTAASEKPKAAVDKDLLARLADAGEDALNRLADLPGGQRAMTAMNDLRNRVDDLTKKVRGIDALESRIAKLEKEVAALKKANASARRTSPPRKPAA